MMLAATAARAPPHGINILIAGGGVGGLMTALECWRRGCNVHVFERTPHNRTSGDSFTIGPSAIRGFEHWPMMLDEYHRTVYYSMVAFHDFTGARIKGPMEFRTLVGGTASNEGRSGSWGRASRPRFHEMLLNQLKRCGVEVESGKNVIDYFEDADGDYAGVVVEGGERCEADLVVAADGLRGNSYKLVKGEPIPAIHSGNAIFRVAYLFEHALKDPEVAERWKLTDEGRSVIEMWVGPDMSSTFWRSEDFFSWAINHKDVLAFTTSILDWPEVANRAIRTTPPNSIVDWKLMWRDPQPTWTSPSGHVIQLGDAGHTFLPTSGNGDTQAIEDAISLATCLAIALSGKDGRPPSHIPIATRVHNLLRFERVSCLQALGVQNRENYNTKSKHGGSPNKVRLRKWITQHDCEKYAVENFQQARAHLGTGAPFQNTNIPPGMVYRPWTIDGLLDAQARGEPTVLDGDWS